MAGLLVAALGALTLGLADYREGRFLMDWWVLELITLAVLLGLAFWLGPFIKRFGRSYAADVFRSNPRTGKSFIVLVDIVYYLIFTAYIFFTVRFEPESGWERHGRARAASVRGLQDRRHPSDHRASPRHEPAAAAGSGKALLDEPAPRREGAAAGH